MREAIIRFRRYFESHGVVIGLTPLILCALATHFRPADWTLFAGLCISFFMVPYPFRHALIKRIDTPLMRFLDTKLLTIGIVASLVLLLLKQRLLLYSELVALTSLFFGIQFWTRTDEMYSMICWLAHPLEHGSPPDDISLLCTRRIDWDGHPETCFVYRFRYGDEISAGITRPLVFSFMDPMGDLSPSEVIDKYRQWYQSDGRKAIDRDTSDRNDNG